MPVFTHNTASDVEQNLQSDFDLIADTIEESGIEFDAIYLIGSFGRGEGSVHHDGERWRGVNDYDICVITKGADPGIMLPPHVTKDLAAQLQIDLVDLMFLPRRWLKAIPASMLYYDLKYGSQLLRGDDVLDEIPSFRPQDVPGFEFLRLLCNRAAGLLTAELPAHADSSDYRQNQIAKACIAVGDVAVYLTHGYHHLYLERNEMFESLVESNSLPFAVSDEAISAIEASYSFKLYRTPAEIACSPETLRTMVSDAFCCLAGAMTNSSSRNFGRLERRLLSRFRDDIPGNPLRRLVHLWRVRKDPDAARRSPLGPDIRRRVLFAQPFFYCTPPSPTTPMRYSYLRRFLTVPGALQHPRTALGACQLWESYKP